MAAVDKASPIITSVSGVGGEIVISIGGELDMSNIEFVRRQIEALLPANPSSLVFDLSELSFMDSSGIALLVQVASRVGTLSLRHVPGLIQRVLQATGVDEVLAVER
jgi:anti-sigma B factor antagonist